MRNVAIAQLIDIHGVYKNWIKYKNKQTNRGMHVYNKIKLWCACCNAITTEMNLKKWGLPVDKTCIICQQKAETMTYILWTCLLAQNVCALSKGKLQKLPSINEEDFFIDRSKSSMWQRLCLVISRKPIHEQLFCSQEPPQCGFHLCRVSSRST